MTDELTRYVRRAIERARQQKQLSQECRMRAAFLIAQTNALLARYDQLERALIENLPPALCAIRSAILRKLAKPENLTRIPPEKVP